jgi:hypothetical protein
MGTREQSEKEAAAKRIFELVTLIELQTNENGRSGRVDYVSVDSNISCAMEVTTYTNQERTALINGSGDYSEIIPRRDLMSDWVIQTRDYPHVKKIKQLVIPQLHTLSVHGINEYYKSNHEWWMRNVPTLKKALSSFNSASVEYVKRQTVVERNEDGSANVVLLPVLNWSFGGADSALEIIETDRKIFPENAPKLLNSGSELRHLFVWVDENTDRNVLDAFNSERLGLPTRPPVLPNGITHLWIVNSVTEVGWYFNPIDRWKIVGVS